jgi:hypothetical protein
MSLNKTLTDLGRRNIDLDKYSVREILPSFFQSDYPLLIKLLEYYYESIEESENASRFLNDLYTIRDVKQAPIELLKFLGEEVLLGDPYFEQFVDQRLSILISNTLYRSKGTKFAIENFFKVFFNVDAEIEYPKNDIFNIGRPQKEQQIYDTSDYRTIVDRNFLYVHDGELLVKAGSTTLVEDEDYFHDAFNKRITILDTLQSGLENSTTVTLEITPKRFSLIGVDLQEKKLINDKLYQLFSLLIKSPLPKSSWTDAYKKFVHPSGMYFQAQVQCFSNVDLNLGPTPFSIPETPELLVEDEASLSPFVYTDLTGIVGDSADPGDATGLLRIPLEPIVLSDNIDTYADNITVEMLNRQYPAIVDVYNIRPPTGDEDSAGIGLSRDSDHYIDVSNALELIDQNFYDDSDGSITI